MAVTPAAIAVIVAGVRGFSYSEAIVPETILVACLPVFLLTSVLLQLKPSCGGGPAAVGVRRQWGGGRGTQQVTARPQSRREGARQLPRPLANPPPVPAAYDRHDGHGAVVVDRHGRVRQPRRHDEPARQYRIDGIGGRHRQQRVLEPA